MKIPGNGMLERQQIPSGLTAPIKSPGEEVHGPCADEQQMGHHVRVMVASLFCTFSIPAEVQR